MKNKNSILVVEDSITQAETLKYILEKAEYTTRHATDGKVAMEMLKEEKPYLILTDIVMPQMNGYELCKLIKEDDKLWDIPVILLTSLSDAKDVIRGIECGADGYIMKPYNEEYLLSRITHTLENKHLLKRNKSEKSLEISIDGQDYSIASNPLQILNLLLSTYDSILQKNIELTERENEIIVMNQSLQEKVEQRMKELTIQLEQKIEAENILKQSVEKYQNMVDTALIGVFISNLKGEISFANEALWKMLECESLEQLIDTGIVHFYKDKKVHDVFVHKLKDEGNVKEFEIECITRNGKSKYIVVNASLDSNNVSGVILDITDKKNANIREKQYQEELIQARGRAEQSDKLKTAFLANMSNEILTPINSLLGFSELLFNENLSLEKLQEYTSNINNSGNNLINLIDNIIDIAKIESGEVKIKLSECKINHMLLDLYAYFEQELKSQNKEDITLYLKRGSKDPDFIIMSEPYRLKQVFYNLLGNAINYTEKGRIDFGYEKASAESGKDQSYLKFFVKDTGKGIHEKLVNQIFDRFKNEDESGDRLSESAGLGLPMSKAYVQLLGGEMYCNSEDGKGSEFTFTLPYHEVKAEKIQVLKNIPILKAVKSQKTVILVAEDVESNFLYIEAVLADTTYELIWARDGMEAVEKFRNRTDISLILMDIRMPRMSGYEAIEEIRKQDKDIPIIVQTAFALEDDIQKIKSCGANDFITKPIMEDVLKLAILKYDAV